MRIDHFHIVVRMRQTVQVSLEIGVSEITIEGGGGGGGEWGGGGGEQSSIRCISDKRSWDIMETYQLKTTKKKKNEIVFLEGVKIHFIASVK